MPFADACFDDIVGASLSAADSSSLFSTVPDADASHLGVVGASLVTAKTFWVRAIRRFFILSSTDMSHFRHAASSTLVASASLLSGRVDFLVRQRRFRLALSKSSFRSCRRGRRGCDGPGLSVKSSSLGS